MVVFDNLVKLFGRSKIFQPFYSVLVKIPGEGDGTPLQCSCLENPRDGGAWWAAVYGVAQSQTRLKRLSSSSQNPTLTAFDFE